MSTQENEILKQENRILKSQLENAKGELKELMQEKENLIEEIREIRAQLEKYTHGPMPMSEVKVDFSDEEKKKAMEYDP